jgi:diguanylate cyclase (GGDEF)-like protein
LEITGRDLHSSIREVAVLQEVTEMILASSDTDTVLHQTLLIVRNYFGVANCAIFLVDQSTGEVYRRASNGYEPGQGRQRMKIGSEGVTGHVAATRQPMYVPDVSKEPRYLQAQANIKSELALPLLVRDELLGVLDMESDKLDFFTDETIGLMALFAAQAAVALENAKLHTTERRRMRQIEFVNLIARSATNASELSQLLTTLSELVSDTFEGSEVSILLRDKSGNLSLEAHAGGDKPNFSRFQESIQHGIIAEALSARMSVLSQDFPSSPSAPAARKKSCIEGAASEMAVPLLSLSEALGVVVISHRSENAFSNDDRSIAQVAGDVCATAVRNLQLAEELRRLANTDSLTGIYNQRYFHIVVNHEITRAKRFAKPFSVLMFDLKNFRAVNQSFGFDEGDRTLRSVAKLLTTSIRALDTCCRYTGGQFALILPEIDEAKVEIVKKKIAKGISELSPGAKQSRVEAIFAVVHYPEDGATELELVRVLLNRMEKEKEKFRSAGA